MDAEHAALGAEGQVLLGFDGGVESGGPAAVLRDAAFEFVDGFDGAVLDDVIDVAGEQEAGVDGVVDGGDRLRLSSS